MTSIAPALYDVAEVRRAFPALREGAAHFDGPGGSQVPGAVADAVSSTLMSAIANRGQFTVAERRSDAIVQGARQAMADLLGAEPGGIVFGRSMTQLTYDFARTLAKTWQPGDEVVVTRLDHDGNIRPWVDAARDAGVTVRWAAFDRDTGELPVSAVAAELSSRTRVVAVTGASNLLGTRPDVAAIAAAAHEVGALCYVDGVHLTPHAAVDIAALGCDFYACSPYKFGGPHLGVLAADPALLEALRPDKLLPSSNAVPERFELGTLPYELLAGVTAAVDFLAGLVGAGLAGAGLAGAGLAGAGLAPTADGQGGSEGVQRDRRSSLRAAFALMAAHESEMLARLDAGLAALPAITRHGRPAHRTPTSFFSVEGHSPEDVRRALAAAGVNAPAGHFYAIECSRWLGLGDTGAVRAGIALYTDTSDIDRLLAALADLVAP